MILFDVNVLLNAHRPNQEHHWPALELIEKTVNDPAPFALSDSVLTAFIRIATDPRAFEMPTPLEVAFETTNQLLSRPNARRLHRTEANWSIFERLCRQTQARGKLVADAHHAALAIEHGCQWISFDRDFAKFPDLNWQHPLDD